MFLLRTSHRVLAIATFFLGSVPLPGIAQIGVWTPIGPTNATVMTLQQDPFNANTLYAGLYFGGIFKTTNNGQTWSSLASPFTSDVVFTLACDPVHQGTIYAGTFQNGLFKTTNGGQTWMSINGGIPSMDDEALGVDPTNSNIVLVGSGANGYRSINGGTTWTPMLQNVRTIFFDPAHSGVVYVSTYSNGVMKSTDDGATFTPFSTGIGNSAVLSIHSSQDGQTLFAAALQGIFELDAGQTVWRNITGSLPWTGTGDILSAPSNPNILLAGTTLGLYTEDKGAPTPTWTRINTVGAGFLYAPAGGSIWFASSYLGLYSATTPSGPYTLTQNGIQNYFVEALGAFPASGGTQVYAGTDRGVFSEPAGGTWTPSTGFVQTIFSLAQSPTSPNTVYAGTQSGGVWSTTNGGTSWAPLANGMVPKQVTGVAQFVDVSPVILAATTNGVFQSLDTGKTWNETLLNAGVLSVATDPSIQASAYVGASGGQVLRTTDYGKSFQAVDASGLPASNVVGLTVIPYDKVYAVLANGQSYALWQNGSSWIQMNSRSPYPITCVAGDPTDIKTTYMGTSGGGVYKTTDFGQTWTQANSGLTGMYIYSIVVDPANSNNVYAATNTGVFKSVTKAGSWQAPGTGLPSAPILSMVISPKGSLNLAVSVLNQGVYRTSDAGNTWLPATVGPPQSGAVTLAVNPLFPATMYAGTTQNGFYMSMDSGDHWLASNSGLSVFVRDVIVDPGNSSRLFAASLSDGLYGSTNGGASWTNLALNDRNLFSIAFNPSNTQTMYAASSLGVSKSTDGGNTWQDVGQKNPYLFSMVVDPSNAATIYTGTSQGTVFKSTDSGLTWSEASAGIQPGDIVGLAMNKASGALYAAIDLTRTYTSKDGGKSWTACGILPALQTSSTTGISVDGSTGSIYISGDSVGVFRSTDGCHNWQSSNAGVYSTNITALLASRWQPSLVFAGTNGAGLYRSSDGATTWSMISKGPSGKVIISIAEDPSTAGTMYAGTDTGVYRSVDYGQTWTALVTKGLPAGTGISSLLPTGGTGPLYAVAGASGVYSLVSGGTTWTGVATTAAQSQIRMLALGSSSQVLYAATLGSGFLRSINGGGTWSPATTPSNVQTVTNVVIADPTNPQIVYAATGGTGVQKSTDGGFTWQAADNGLTQLYIVAMVMDPTNSQVLYVGAAQGGVFVTRNGGQSWSSLVNGLYDTNVVALALDGNNHNILYAGTEGAGVFRIQLQ